MSAPAQDAPESRACRTMNAGEVTGLPVERAAAFLPAELIHNDEIVVLLLRPSVLFIPLSCAWGLMLIAIIALTFALLKIKLSWLPWTEQQAYLLGISLVLLRLGWQSAEWYCRVYVLTDRRIIRRMGVLRVSVFETPLKQIQHTSVFVRLRERLFGLGTIGFATAGSDVFEAFWVMIRRPFAVHRRVLETIQRYGHKRGPET